MNRKPRKRLPGSKRAQQDDAAPESERSADERDEHRLGEQLAHDAAATGAQREPYGNFSGTVGGAGSEQAAEVGAGRKQDERGKQRESGYEPAHRPAQEIAVKTRTRQAECEVSDLIGIRLLQIGSDGVQIGDRLRGRDAGLEVSHDVEHPALAAGIQVTALLELLLVD